MTDVITRSRHFKRKDIFPLRASYTQSEFYQLTINKNDTMCLVYEFNKEIVGMIELEVTSTYGDNRYNYINTLVIKKIAVKEDYRRCGIGTKLFNYAREYAKKRRIYNIKFSVYNFNKDAVKFIKSVGMKEYRAEYEIIT